jgi:hypothetical protein
MDVGAGADRVGLSRLFRLDVRHTLFLDGDVPGHVSHALTQASPLTMQGHEATSVRLRSSARL